MGIEGFGVYGGFWMCGYKGLLFDMIKKLLVLLNYRGYNQILCP